jgi:oligosaccharide translocation protein RFT1
VVNLGSLVVRTAFQPFEEAAFTSFSTSGESGACCLLFTCATGSLALRGAPRTASHMLDDIGLGVGMLLLVTLLGAAGDKQQSARLLALLVRAVAIVGSLSAAFGPAYAWLLLHLLYGPRWSATAAPAALSLYSWFILLLAVSILLHTCPPPAYKFRRLQAWACQASV